MPTLFKILTSGEWADFQQNGTFSGTELDKKDKFMHLAFKHQYPSLIEKFFKKATQVILIEIDADKLNREELKIEPNKPGGEKYPHLYSENINLEVVLSHEEINLDPAARNTPSVS